MDETAAWVQTKISEHAIVEASDAMRLERLMSACVALKGGYGTVFGLVTPPEGLDDVAGLYQAACSAMQAWVDALPSGATKDNLISFVLKRELSVSVPDTYRQAERPKIDWQSALDRKDAIGDIARVVARLERNGVSVVVSKLDPIPGAKVDDLLEDERSLLAISEALTAWPERVALEWFDDATEIGGAFFYELDTLVELNNEHAAEVEEWQGGLPYYYSVWSECVPFMRTPDGSGVLAVRARTDEVLYLDHKGITELNGTVLAFSFEEFWRTWVSLCFVAIDPSTVELIRKDGFSETSSIGALVSRHRR